MTDRERLRDLRRAATDRLPALKTRLTLGFLAGVTGTLLVAAAPNPHMGWLQWLALAVGSVLVVGAAAGTSKATDDHGTGAHAVRRSGDHEIPGWLRRGLRTLVTLSLITFFVVVAGPPLGWLVRSLSYDVAGCPPAAQLRMVADPESIMTARELAAAYERRTAEDDYGCPPTRVYVFPATSTAIVGRLQATEAWSDDSTALSTIGPRPDVWLASTSHEVNVLRAGGRRPIPVAEPIPVARSPLVLAVPAPAEHRDATWSALFREYLARGGVVRPAPSSSALGLQGAALLYGSERATQWPPFSFSAIERRLAAARDAAAVPVGDVTDLLCRRRTTAPSGSVAPPAIVASEQEVARYNAGLPLGGSCTDTTRPAPDRQLVAQYPTDTGDQVVSLIPFTWSDPAQQRAAAAFGSWLGSAAGRAALVDTGLRPLGSSLDVPLTVGPGVELVRPPSDPVTDNLLTAAAASYATTQRPSRLLFVFDTSGSMGTPDAGGTRGRVAAEAVKAALRHLGQDDEFGLWFFPGGTGSGHTEPVPVAKSSPAQVAAAEAVLDELPLAGRTPLFRAVVDGVTTLSPEVLPASAPLPPEVAARDPFGVRALIVLTDGENTVPGLTADDVVHWVANRGVRVVVVALGEIRCTGGGLPAIVEKSGGGCVDADTSAGDEGVLKIVDDLKGAG